MSESNTLSATPDFAQRPTGLRPVMAVIPPHCYERSTARGLGILARDLLLYAAALVGLVLFDGVLVTIALWLVAGLAVAALFVVGHDAAHGALFDSARLNAAVGRIAMLPSLHATELWIFGHNRVHHGHTLRQGMDFVWHPLTIEEYRTMGRLGRLRHRFEWGPFGAGAYYLREVWWNKMVRFTPPSRSRRAMRRDQLLVVAFVFGTLLAAVLAGGTDGIWTWARLVVVPFLIFCQLIGWVVHVHHISPDIRWWPRREWNRFRGQVEGTTVLWGPPGWDLFFHWIMVHLPHHVDMRIPCYRLPEAALAIAEEYPDEVIQRRISPLDYWRSTRACKLHDFETGTWHRYP